MKNPGLEDLFQSINSCLSINENGALPSVKFLAPFGCSVPLLHCAKKSRDYAEAYYGTLHKESHRLTQSLRNREPKPLVWAFLVLSEQRKRAIYG